MSKLISLNEFGLSEDSAEKFRSSVIEALLTGSSCSRIFLVGSNSKRRKVGLLHIRYESIVPYKRPDVTSELSGRRKKSTASSHGSGQ
jgi:hypothetical protein